MERQDPRLPPPSCPPPLTDGPRSTRAAREGSPTGAADGARLPPDEPRFRQLVEQAPDIIYRTDASGFFTYVNPAASRLMGYSAQHLVGTHFSALVREDHRERVTELLVAQFRDRRPATYDEFPVLPRDGRELWIGQNVRLIAKGGGVEGFQAVARDITERKRAQLALERERQQLRDIVTHAPVAMAILDSELRYVALSGEWSRLWGLEGKPIVGQPHTAVSPRPLGRHLEAVRRALGGEVVSSPEDVVELADGSRLYMRWSIHPWRDPEGAVAGVVAVAQNVDVLVRARQAAEDALRHKSEFLANVSHELRTPLGQVIAVSGLLEQTSLDGQQRLWVEHVRDAAGELLARIDGILDFARLEAEPIELRREAFDPRALAQEIARSFANAAAGRGLVLSYEPAEGIPARVKGDPERVRQALHQLLANAIKFTPSGAVRLRLAAAGTAEAPVLTFEVEDTGPGLTDEQQARLFQPFTQLDGSPSRRHGGTGLGLALARRLAHAMGGELSVRSAAGSGCTFALAARFERADRPAAPAPASPAGAAPDAKVAPRILVAEDDPINRKVVLAMLEKLGYRGEAVANGLEAVEACTNESYDAVLMDCMMPEMDGYRATAWIRQREAGRRRVPVVALTASTAPGDREKCFASGMDAYISKPMSLRTLEETLRRWATPAERPPSPPDAPPSTLPPSHPLRALEAQGRQEAVMEIIDLFLETTPLRLERLREVARQRDLAVFLSLAHSLRGAALHLGASRVADLCAEAQAVAREGTPERLSPLFDALQAEFRDAARVLEAERHRLSGPAAR
jgi:PAS domain S-box-containing protein